MKPIDVFDAMDKSFMMIVLKSEKMIIFFYQFQVFPQLEFTGKMLQRKCSV